MFKWILVISTIFTQRYLFSWQFLGLENHFQIEKFHLNSLCLSKTQSLCNCKHKHVHCMPSQHIHRHPFHNVSIKHRSTYLYILRLNYILSHYWFFILFAFSTDLCEPFNISHGHVIYSRGSVLYRNVGYKRTARLRIICDPYYDIQGYPYGYCKLFPGWPRPYADWDFLGHPEGRCVRVGNDSKVQSEIDFYKKYETL